MNSENAEMLRHYIVVDLDLIGTAGECHAAGIDDHDIVREIQREITDVAKQVVEKAQATAAKQVNVLAEVQPLQNKYANIKAPYFVQAAKQATIPALYFTNLISARPLMGPAGAGSLPSRRPPCRIDLRVQITCRWPSP